MWVAEFDKEEHRPVVVNRDVGVKMVVKGGDMHYARSVAHKMNTPTSVFTLYNDDLDDGK